MHTWPALFQEQEQIPIFKGDEDKPYFNPCTKFPQLSSTVGRIKVFVTSQSDSEQLKPQDIFKTGFEEKGNKRGLLIIRKTLWKTGPTRIQKLASVSLVSTDCRKYNWVVNGRCKFLPTQKGLKWIATSHFWENCSNGCALFYVQELKLSSPNTVLTEYDTVAVVLNALGFMHT